MVVLGLVCAAVAARWRACPTAPRRGDRLRRAERRPLQGTLLAALTSLLAVCALAPLAWPHGVATEAPATTPTEWPREWNGRALRPLALGSVEARFAAQFPGRIERLTDEESVLVWREVRTPTRMLHPATDCYRGLGYRVVGARLERDPQARLWRCFVAERDGRRVRVCERIEDARGLAFTDASAWFWAAQLGSSTGPWQAITVATPLGSPIRKDRSHPRAAFAALFGIVLAASAMLFATALYALRAAPGDWSVRRIGPVGVALSVPALIRVATNRSASAC